MANEARVFAEGVENCIVRQITVADGTAIPKGTLLVYDAATRTGKAHTSTAMAERPLGFTVSDKVASDGNTTVGVQRTGVVAAHHTGVITTGDWVKVSQSVDNEVERVASASWSYQEFNEILGRAIESGAGTGQIKIALGLF